MTNDNRTELKDAVARTKPVHEVRLGRVKAAVWANDTESGVRHNVTISRIYRNETWRTTESFGRDDLLLLAKVLDLAHTWICEQGRVEDMPI